MIFEPDLLAYADDSAVRIAGKNWTSIAALLTRKLNRIASWLYQNRLILNVDKSTFITFGNYRDSVPDELQVGINGCDLKRVSSCKYLGLTYDFNLKWDVYINDTVKKLKYLVYVFYKLRQMLTRKQLLQIYFGIFNSVAVYGIIGWGGIYNSNFDQLDRLQKRILKIIGISDDAQDRPLDIKQIFILNSIVYQYQELKNEYQCNPINTRFKSVKLPKYSSTIFERSYKYFSKKFFNKLPNNLKCLNTSNKKLLKKSHKVK